MSPAEAHIQIDEDEVLVTGAPDLHARHARRFFQVILGGERLADGWRIPSRARRMQDLAVQINAFLNAEGFSVSRGEVAERGVQLALERRRSIDRARTAATFWKAGHSSIDDQSVESELDRLGWQPERKLHTHQLRNVGHALAAVNQANFSVPGAGKTATALAVALMHFAAETIDAILVVGPLASFRPWEAETAAAVGPRFRPSPRCRDQGHRAGTPTPGCAAATCCS